MRPLLLLAVALLLPPAAHAQGVPPTGSTVASGGGPGGDIGEAIAVDDILGETVVVGTFEQTATFGGVSVTSADAPAARSDAFVVKYDRDGTALWARRMGTGVFNDFGAGVAIESRSFSGGGNVYVSGYFTGIATFDGGANPAIELTTRNDFDAFLAAYSGDGDLLWVEQAGGAEQDTGRGVAVGDGGRVFWTGSFTGTATWGTGAAAQTRTSAGSSDGFLARYHPDGTLERLLTVGGSEGDDLRGVATVVPFGGSFLFVTGTFRGVARFGPRVLQSRGLSDVAVVGVTEECFVAWAQGVGGSGNDYARGVAASYTGRVGAAGSFENDMLVGQDVLTSAGFSDAFLGVFENDGTPVTGFRGGGAGFDIATGVAASPYVPIPVRGGTPADPVFALTGYIDGPSTFGATAVAAQGVDAFAALYRDVSSLPPVQVDVLRIGGTNSDRGAGVAIGGFPQTLALTGNFRDQLPFAGSTATSAGGNDVFVARVPLCPTYSCFTVDGEADPEAATSTLSVSPNPSRRPTVTLRLNAPADLTVEVVDVLGRVVAVLYRGALPAGETRLAAGPRTPGTYVVRAGGISAPFVVVR